MLVPHCQKYRRACRLTVRNTNTSKFSSYRKKQIYLSPGRIPELSLEDCLESNGFSIDRHRNANFYEAENSRSTS